jgi:lysophospholipase L1-like esterase
LDTQVLVLGDSVGETLVHGLGHAGIRVVDGTRWGCRLTRGRIRFTLQVGEACPWPALWRRVVHEYRPKVVVLISGVWDLFDVRPLSSKHWLVPGSKAWARYYEATLEKAVNVLSSTGAHVIIPTIPFVSGATAGPGAFQASSQDPARVRAANAVLARVAARNKDRVSAPDLNRYLSPDGHYQQSLGLVPIVRIDGVHFNVAGADLVGSWLAPRVTPFLGNKAIRKHRKPGPVRLLLVGDSITVNYQGVAASLLARKGYQVTQAGYPRSGLLDADLCDGRHARELLAYADPDVVVFEANGNYALAGGPVPCPPVVAPGSTEWYRRWKAAARLNQNILTSNGAKFLWVLNPSVSSEPKRSRLPRINAIYRRLAGKRARLVDAWRNFGGTTFDQRLRYDDQHLNAAGAKRLSFLIVLAVR